MENLIFFIVNIIINALLANNIVLCAKYIFRSRIPMSYHVLFVTLFSTVISSIVQMRSSIINMQLNSVLKMSVFVITFILIKSVLGLNLKKSILTFCITLVSTTIAESLTLAMFLLGKHDISQITTGENIYLYALGNIGINILLWIILYIIKLNRIMSLTLNGMKGKTQKYIILNLIITMVTFILIIIIMNVNIEEKGYVTAVYFILSVLGLVCNLSSIHMMINIDLRDEKIKMQEAYNDMLGKLKHNFSGMVSIIMGMAEDNDIEGIKDFVRGKKEEMLDNGGSIPLTIKNSKLFYLLALKVREGHEKGVRVRVLVPNEFDAMNGIKEDDFIYIINELMSNAIENAARAKDKLVYLRLDNGEEVKLTVENTVSDEVLGDKLKVLNGEKHKRGRGQGLNMVRSMISESCYFKTSIEDMFIVEIGQK